MGSLTRRLPQLFSSHAALGGDINVTSMQDGSWHDSGITVTLPATGTYTLYFSLALAASNAPTFDNYWVQGRLYNEDTEVVVPGSLCYLKSDMNLAPNADYFVNQSFMQVVFSGTAGHVISLQISTHGGYTSLGIEAANTYVGYTCWA